MGKPISAGNSQSTNADPRDITGTDVEVGGVAKRGLDMNVLNQIQGSFSLSGLNIALEVTNTTIGTTATALPATALSQRNSIIIQNLSTTQSIYLGNSDVTASGANEGWEVTPDSFFSLDITDSVVIYAIASSTGIPVKILELA